MIASIAAALPGLHERALMTLRGRLPCPVETYGLILRGMAGSDLTAAEAEPMRRRFNAYYGVRRNAVWRSNFYRQFENAKASALDNRALFGAVLEGIFQGSGRVEASFSSKLVATLRPDGPIIDSVVRTWLARHGACPPFKGGLSTVAAYYAWLNETLQDVSHTAEAEAWRTAFTTAFPPASPRDAVSPMKQLDFLIWAGADR